MGRLTILLLTPLILICLCVLAISYKACEKFYNLEVYLSGCKNAEPFAACFLRDFVDN